MEKNMKKIMCMYIYYVYVYIYLIHLAVHQKLA